MHAPCSTNQRSLATNSCNTVVVFLAFCVAGKTSTTSEKYVHSLHRRSRLLYCISLLAGLPACATRPLWLIQIKEGRLFPKFSYTTRLPDILRWLPVPAPIRLRTLVLAYCAANRSGPSSIQATVKPARPIRSMTEKPLASP